MNIKRVTDKYTDLAQVLKNNPMRVIVKRTTMKTVSPSAGKFDFHSIVKPAPAYFYRVAFDVNFKEKLQDMQDNITLIKAKLEYEKLQERVFNRNRKGTFFPNQLPV